MSWYCLIADGLLRWEAATALATWFAAFVVLFQLRSVGNQIKLQTNQLTLQAKQLKLQHYADYTKRYQAIILKFPEDINDTNFRMNKRRRDYGQTMRHMRAYFDLCFEEWDLYRRGLIDKEAWAVWQDGIRTALSKPAFQQAWDIIKASNTEYGESFQQFVEGSIPVHPVFNK